MTIQQSDDEYALRARYLSWCLEAFLAADHHNDAIRTTCTMLRNKAHSDDVAAEISTAMFVWVSRWHNPYRIASTAVDRYDVITELRHEVLAAKELAAL